jgi:hypothetical protein
MPEINLVTEQLGAVRLIPLTTNANDLVTALGTKQDYPIAFAESPEFANEDQASQEYYTKEVSGDRIYRRPKNTKTIELASGSEAESTGDSVDQLKFSVLVTAAQRDQIIALRNKRVVAIIGWINRDGTVAGFDHLAGKISGAITPTIEDGMLSIALTIAGKSFEIDSGATITHTQYNTAATGTITPDNKSAVTIKDFVADDFTKLKTGYIVTTGPHVAE